ncbi:ATP-binding protein [Pseudomonas sp. NW5]|uniref:ATP-binding protein n=1 Tax=Pseudomonas sp. NW5 TaxID=2934934 RepID=UPI002020FB84|nr:ATP-binding protein [Pseudomonas sp. NW5]MCL7462644.1 ATP-binding protein [Pseudomonas sp. NW5]
MSTPSSPKHLASVATALWQQTAVLIGCLLTGLSTALLSDHGATLLAWPFMVVCVLAGVLTGPRAIAGTWLAATLLLLWMMDNAHNLLLDLTQTLIPAACAGVSGWLTQKRLREHQPPATPEPLLPSRSPRGQPDDRLIEALPQALLISSDGYCSHASRAALQLLGTSHSALLGQPLLEWAYAESQAALQRHLQQRPPDAPPLPATPIHLQRANAKDLWLRVHSVPCHYRGRPATLLLLEELAPMQGDAGDDLLFRLSQDLLAYLDDDGHLLRINPALAARLEPSTRPFLGQSLSDVLHPDDRPHLEQALHQALQTQTPQRLETRLRSPSQQWLWVDWQLSAHGAGWLLCGRDTTEQHRHQQLQHMDRATAPQAATAHDAQIEHALTRLLDHLIEGVLTLDTHGRILHSNPAAQRLFGLESDALTRLSLPQLLSSPDRDHLQEALISHAAGEDTPWLAQRLELHAQHRSGRTLILELSLFQHTLRGHTQWVATLRDISERRVLIDSLTEARREAEQASEAKSSFLATMSHEIRTPMNGVLGMLEVLAHTPLDAQQEEMVGVIRDSATLLLGIINDILDFSKIEASRLEIESVALSSATLIEQVCALLDRQALQNGVELTLFTDPQIPASLLGDPLRLRQVLVNLLGNAIKFSRHEQGHGRVEVRSRLLSRDQAMVHLEISVRDNGIGISAEAQRHLFQAFTQADSSTTRRFGGTGLGLAICHRLVTLMGGRIEVDSRPGEGSTFRVLLSLPLAESAAAPTTQRLDGVCALIVGLREGLLADLACYLEDEGVWLSHLPTLSSPLTDRLARRAQFCLISADHAAPSQAQLETAAQAWQLPGLPFLCIGHGEQRQAQRRSDTQVQIDRHLLRRNSFIEAVELTLGRRVEPVRRAATTQSLSAPSRAEALASGRLILLAEDNAINQKVLLRQLGLIGLTADVANDGVEALQRWHSGDYALLLSDLQMPNMDGLQLAQAIRDAEGPVQHLPIIALTANTQQGAIQACLAAGMDDYLSKPAQIEELRAMIERWLPPRASAPAPAAVVPAPAPTASPVATAPVSPDAPPSAFRASDPRTLDLDVLRAMVGDEDEVLDEFLADFRAAAARMLDELDERQMQDDAAAIASLAHRLKSNARSVGALNMGELCARLEEAGNQRQPGAPRAALLEALRQEWEHVADGIDRRLG